MKKKNLFILVILISSLSIQLSSMEVPPLTGRIVDRGNILSAEKETEISQYLEDLENKTGAQIAVLTIPSLYGVNLEKFSYNTASQWALGEAGKNNGVLLLIVVKDKKIRIEVGYGLEYLLTDATCGYIIRNVITPSFQSGYFEKGVFDGVKVMGKLISSENPDISFPKKKKSVRRGFNKNLIPLYCILFFVLILAVKLFFFTKGFIPKNNNRYRSRRGSSGFYYGSGRSSGSGGSFSGGGFSGGGGSFGGGGASGGW